MNLKNILDRLVEIDDAGNGCDELDDLMKEIEAVLAEPHGIEALGAFTVDQQQVISAMLEDEIADMSTKDKVALYVENWDRSDFERYLTDVG